MLGRYFKREEPRVFLGVLAVAPRTDLRRHFEETGVFEDANLDSTLRQCLVDIFSLPPVQSVSSPLATDLVLDVVVPKFQSGSASGVSLVEIGCPIFWRPSVTVASRLYSLTTQETKATFSVTERMQWGLYLSRVTSWRGFLRVRPTFDRKDIEYLLYEACGKLLSKMQKAI